MSRSSGLKFLSVAEFAKQFYLHISIQKLSPFYWYQIRRRMIAFLKATDLDHVNEFATATDTPSKFREYFARDSQNIFVENFLKNLHEEQKDQKPEDLYQNMAELLGVNIKIKEEKSEEKNREQNKHEGLASVNEKIGLLNLLKSKVLEREADEFNLKGLCSNIQAQVIEVKLDKTKSQAKWIALINQKLEDAYLEKARFDNNWFMQVSVKRNQFDAVNESLAEARSKIKTISRSEVVCEAFSDFLKMIETQIDTYKESKQDELETIQKVLKYFFNKGQFDANVTDALTYLETLPKSNLVLSLRTPLKKLVKMLENIAAPPGIREDASFVDKRESSGGANPGFRETRQGEIRTIKQGSTQGNTLAEYASYLRLERLRQTTENTHQTIAKAELRPTITTDAENFVKNLYVDSVWSSDFGSLEASKLFGFATRPKGAGTRYPEMFKRLRELNAECQLGLEDVLFSAITTADFDLHTDNFMLKMDVTGITDDLQKAEAMDLIESFKKFIDSRRSRLFHAKNFTEAYLNKLVSKIKEMQGKGVNLYFHKIDHDSGFYRYCDLDRRIDLKSHRSSPFASKKRTPLKNSGIFLQTQPTQHIGELLTGGDPVNSEQLLLSERAKKIIRTNTIINQEKDTQLALWEFFDSTHEKAQLIECKEKKGDVLEQEQLRAELMLLREFHSHVTHQSYQSDKAENIYALDSDIIELREKIKNDIIQATIIRGLDINSQLIDACKKDSQHLKDPEFFEELNRQTLHGFSRLILHQWPKIRKEFKDLEPEYQVIKKMYKSTEFKELDDKDKAELEKAELTVLAVVHARKNLSKSIMGDVPIPQVVLIETQVAQVRKVLDLSWRDIPKQYFDKANLSLFPKMSEESDYIIGELFKRKYDEYSDKEKNGLARRVAYSLIDNPKGRLSKIIIEELQKLQTPAKEAEIKKQGSQL